MNKVNVLLSGRPENTKQVRIHLTSLLDKIKYVDKSVEAHVIVACYAKYDRKELIEKIETKYKQLNNLRPI